MERPSRRPSSRSPGFTGPTPAGVPVNSRSPVFQVLYFETWEISASTGNSMSAVWPLCTTSPFLSNSNRMSCTFPPRSASGTQSRDTTALPSKALAFSQGLPLAFSADCTSRAVKSMPRPMCV